MINLFFVIGCGNKFIQKNGTDPSSFATVNGLSFQDVFNQVLDKDKNCTECHNSYSNYQIVFSKADSILKAVLSDRMPKNKSPLSNELKAILASWVKYGAPNIPGLVSEMKPLEPTFESLLVNVFAPKCLDCHSGIVGAPGPIIYNFSTYMDFIESDKNFQFRNGIGLVDQSAPEDSELILLVTDKIEPMPPLKLRGVPPESLPKQLTEDEVNVLIEWIAKGYPEK